MKIEIPIKIISLEGDGYHCLVKATVNGKSALMVVDTGASKTVFDSKRVRNFVGKKRFTKDGNIAAGIGTNTMKSHLVNIEKLKIGKLELKNFQIVLIDLAHVNQAYSHIGHKPIDGIIGCDIFVKYQAVIDFKKKVLVLKN